jgi:hypothetical protein
MSYVCFCHVLELYLSSLSDPKGRQCKECSVLVGMLYDSYSVCLEEVLPCLTSR